MCEESAGAADDRADAGVFAAGGLRDIFSLPCAMGREKLVNFVQRYNETI